MKKFFGWLVCAAALMIGLPWLVTALAGSAGMAICFLLFFGANPLFCAACGAFAGANIRKFWVLPAAAAVLFLAGVWLFFELLETAFLLYCGGYLAIGVIAMLISAAVHRSRR